MCVWQSHAPAGTSNFTGVAGCEATARTGVGRRPNTAAAAAAAPARTLRREIIRCSSLDSTEGSLDLHLRVVDSSQLTERRRRPVDSELLTVNYADSSVCVMTQGIAYRGSAARAARLCPARREVEDAVCGRPQPPVGR